MLALACLRRRILSPKALQVLPSRGPIRRQLSTFHFSSLAFCLFRLFIYYISLARPSLLLYKQAIVYEICLPASLTLIRRIILLKLPSLPHY